MVTDVRAHSNGEARAQRAEWLERRRAAVTAPTGDLALVETRWYPDDERPDIDREQTGAGDHVVVTPIERRDVTTSRPQYGLRRWDADSAAIRAFRRIEAFDFDPDWVIEAHFDPVSTDRTIPFEHIRDRGGTRDLVVPGDITFTRDGVDYTFAAFDDDGELLLVFGDPTNRRDDESATYPSGRFLFVTRADDASFGTAGTVILDFNRAFVPPCGFSAQYNCPLPPPQNRFDTPVEAGEKHVIFADGFDLYAP